MTTDTKQHGQLTKYLGEWAISCESCPDGLWRRVEGSPITYGSRKSAERGLFLHDQFEHRGGQPVTPQEIATKALMPFTHTTSYGTAAMNPEPPMRIAYEVCKALGLDVGPNGDATRPPTTNQEQ